MNGIVYARNSQDRTLTFAVSGLLWESNLVMVDEETETFWSHLLGKAMQGPLKGQQLETLPSVITDWESWKAGYADSSVAVMSKTSEFQNNNPRMRDQMTVAITLEGEQRYWPFPFLAENVVNDQIGEYPIVVAYHEPKLTAAIYDRRIADRELTFFLDFASGTFHDHETKSAWDVCTGTAVSGPLKGSQLTRLPSVTAEGMAYSTFHPQSRRGRRAGPRYEPAENPAQQSPEEG